MRDIIIKFARSEEGASLVEYAVALIVVTIIGGAGVIALGQNAGGVAEAGCDTTAAARQAAVDAGATIATAAGTCN